MSVALVGCGSSSKEKRAASLNPENFESTSAHTRSFEATESQTCEAARRALLSQGYQVKDANSQLVSGVKSFQPENEVHMELQMRVVCAKDERARASDAKPSSLAFVSALQERYAMKKVMNSAGVGVGLLGSISLPYSSSEDAMVKVASQTVTDEHFYERFYSLLDRYLVAEGPDPLPPPPPASEAQPKSDGKPDAAAKKD